MRYVLIIGDGIADRPVAPLGGKTPLEALALPGMARLASQRMGLARTVPEGVAPAAIRPFCPYSAATRAPVIRAARRWKPPAQA